MSHNSLMRLVLFAIMSFYAVGPAGAQTSIDSLLTPFLARYELPALAAAVARSGNIIAVGHKRNKSLISHSSPLALRSMRSAWRPER